MGSVMRILLLTSCLALASCVSPPTVGPVQMINGIPTHYISCAGSDDISACYEAAAATCPGGKYTVLAKADQKVFTGTSGYILRNLRITCDTSFVQPQS